MRAEFFRSPQPAVFPEGKPYKEVERASCSRSSAGRRQSKNNSQKSDIAISSVTKNIDIRLENFERSDGKSSSRGGGFRRRVA